ncbi:hypothetical protein BCR34DRAFT_576393 [Clohesyomyces aquaticus]|uniref:Uncharacterized protein n=1 Tax=Clohesyomyces aquaticus TaxID=1231657 RepID=A0A1Y1YNZ5_9PLEO|nr:hypothetical protein BCR34DRAFT_576393 [Clohesyomyces aquaticus]
MEGEEMRFYVSGFRGTFTSATAIAYFYRGHHIYAPNGNPVEPMSFASGKKTVITGLTMSSAPIYDLNHPNLVDEREVAALWKSKLNEEMGAFTPYKLTDEDFEMKPSLRKAASAAAAAEAARAARSRESSRAAPSLRLPGPELQAPVPEMACRAVSRFTTEGDIAPDALSMFPEPRRGSGPKLFVPHDRAHFLAVSAPVSKHASPYASRSTSPAMMRDAGMRAAATSSRITQVMEEAGVMLHDAEADVRTKQGVQFTNPNIFTNSDGDINTRAEGTWVDRLTTPSPKSDMRNYPSAFPSALPSPVQSRRVSFIDPFASAPNAPVPATLLVRCTIHGADCDGVSVMNPENTTQRYLLRGGFVEDVPMIVRGGDRVMVDWQRVADQESEVMSVRGMYGSRA